MLKMGILLIVIIIGLLGLTAGLELQWRADPWPVVGYLVRFSLVILSITGVGTLLWESMLGRKEPLGARLVGGLLFGLLLAAGLVVLYDLLIYEPEDMTRWERWVRSMSSSFGSMGAAIVGRAIAQRLRRWARAE